MPVEWYPEEVVDKIRRATMRGIVIGTEMVRTEAIRLVLETPKTGRTYTRRGVTHQASAPGEPFASDTGYAVNQITTNYDMAAMVGYVNFGAEYAAYLEFGTARMEPRPVARPALANKRDDIIQMGLTAELVRVLRG